MTLKRVTVSCYNLLTARGNRLRFLKRIVKILAPLLAKGVRWATRIFLVNTWGQDIRHILQPWVQIGWWDADYPGKRLPIFDLGTPAKPKWNEEWWEQYRLALGWVKLLGGIAHLVLGDFCSLKKPEELKYHDPIRSNVQRYPDWNVVKPDHDPVIPDSWYGQGMRPYWRAFWKRAIAEARAILGEDFDVEIMNEADVESMPVETLLDWHNWAVKTVIALGVPKERIIASASRGAAEIAATVGTFSCHGHARPDQVEADYFGIPHEKIEISTDGGTGGHGRGDIAGDKGPSWAEIRGIARAMKKNKYLRFEGWDRGIEGKLAASTNTISRKKILANVDLFNGGALAAFVEEWRRLEES